MYSFLLLILCPSANLRLLRLECRWLRDLLRSIGSLLYMTHPLCVSHYCGVVTAVGLRGRLGGLLLCMAPEDEAVDVGERVQLRFGCGVGARRVHYERGSAHLVRVRSFMYSSRLRRRIRTALPTFAALMWPSRTRSCARR